MAKLPSKLDLKKLPIDELITLHTNVSDVLQARAESESNDLEEKLKRLQAFLGGKTESKPKAAPAGKKGKKRGRPRKQKAKVVAAVEASAAAAPASEVVAAKPVAKRRGRPKGSVNKKTAVVKKVVKRRILKAEKVDKRKGPRSASTQLYVDPATKATWAGRGRTPKWLVELEKKGRKRTEFLK